MLLLRQTSKALSHPSTHLARQHARHLYQTPPLSTLDPRLASYGRVIQDDYATLRDRYSTSPLPPPPRPTPLTRQPPRATPSSSPTASSASTNSTSP